MDIFLVFQFVMVRHDSVEGLSSDQKVPGSIPGSLRVCGRVTVSYPYLDLLFMFSCSAVL